MLFLIFLVDLGLLVFLDFGQNHFRVVEDTVKRGHLLVRVIGLYGVLVQVVGEVLLALYYFTDISDEDFVFHFIIFIPNMVNFFFAMFFVFLFSTLLRHEIFIIIYGEVLRLYAPCGQILNGI